MREHTISDVYLDRGTEGRRVYRLGLNVFHRLRIRLWLLPATVTTLSVACTSPSTAQDPPSLEAFDDALRHSVTVDGRQVETVVFSGSLSNENNAQTVRPSQNASPGVMVLPVAILDSLLAKHTHELSGVDTPLVNDMPVSDKPLAFTYDMNADGSATLLPVKQTDNAKPALMAVPDGFMLRGVNSVQVSDLRIDDVSGCQMMRVAFGFSDPRSHTIYQGYGSDYALQVRSCDDVDDLVVVDVEGN